MTTEGLQCLPELQVRLGKTGLERDRCLVARDCLVRSTNCPQDIGEAHVCLGVIWVQSDGSAKALFRFGRTVARIEHGAETVEGLDVVGIRGEDFWKC